LFNHKDLGKKKKVFILVKNLDGGTGTFCIDLYKYLSHTFSMTIICLEKPYYRKKYPKKSIFFYPNNFFPRVYKTNLKNITSFVKEIFKLRTILESYDASIILSIDIYCNLLALINKFFSILN
jgi:hypothetical protein